MAKTEITQNSFVGGEWSPKALGRSDSPRYQTAMRRIENAIVLPQGPMRRRWGTRFIARAKNNERVRMIPFVFSVDQSYEIEAGANYFRFYADSARLEVAGVPVEVATPYTLAQARALTFVQYADTMYLCHPDVAPYRLQRVTSLQWKMGIAPFVVHPSAEVGPSYAVTLTSVVNGVGTAMTSGAAVFLQSDVGRQVLADIGVATITAWVSATQVTVNASGFLAGSYAAGAWVLDTSPKTICTASGFANRKNSAITLTLTLAGWRAADVGSYVAMNEGQVEITGFTSSTIVTGVLREVFDTTATIAESGAWSLEQRAWSATRGYPRACALHEQRLVFGGTYAEPVSIWASVIGLPLDLSRGVRTASGFKQDFFGPDMSTIMHLVSSTTTLLALTAAIESAAGGAIAGSMSATNIQQRTGSTHGSSDARPVNVGNDLIMVQRSGKKLRALAYNETENALWAPDITWESEHITGTGVTQPCYVKDPDPQLYCVRNDGQMPSACIERQSRVLEHSVLAWARQITSGLFVSCSAVRYQTQDQLWMAVERVVNGATVVYIELADDALQTDCAVTLAGPNTTWTVGTYLEGRTVDLRGDGYEIAQRVVTGGVVTTVASHTALEVGLHFDTVGELPPIEPQGESFGGAAVSVHEVVVDLVDTIGLTVQGVEARFFRWGFPTNPPPAKTGPVKVGVVGGENGGAITVGQAHPSRWMVRKITRRYTVNEG